MRSIHYGQSHVALLISHDPHIRTHTTNHKLYGSPKQSQSTRAKYLRNTQHHHSIYLDSRSHSNWSRLHTLLAALLHESTHYGSTLDKAWLYNTIHNKHTTVSLHLRQGHDAGIISTTIHSHQTNTHATLDQKPGLQLIYSFLADSNAQSGREKRKLIYTHNLGGDWVSPDNIKADKPIKLVHSFVRKGHFWFHL